ncbi:hypothetical protein LTS08_001455 [Lithohypha guttulata]|nr:hypothetical protein LTS08_001455 [Lithohypha guttulata]
MATPTMSYTPLEVLNVPDSNVQKEAPSKSLYVSHFISTWNSRGFEFGAVLFLSTIYPGTLLPMSVYALVRALAAIALSPAVGRFIDHTNRLLVVRVSVWGQRAAVVLSCCIFLILLRSKDSLLEIEHHALFAVLISLACIEKLCIVMNTIAVERDWAVVIADDNEDLLQEMNSQMRRIDLFCKLVSPLAVALVDGFSTFVAILVTMIVNGISFLVEIALVAWPGGHDAGRANSWISVSTFQSITSSFTQQVKCYARSQAFLPSLSLSLLYLTVLSFSGQMVTYLFAIDHPRLTSVHIGILRTVATISEISATFIAPNLIHRVGAVRAGMWSLCWQFVCLTPGVLMFWIGPESSPVFSTYFFIVCVILSRIGLWSFDLTAQLLVQNSIGASQRGTFSATEASLQNFFELCTFAMTVVWSRPDQFRYPAAISLDATYVAAACYARYVRVERGHLLHLPSCFDSAHGYKSLPPIEEGEDTELR